MRIHRIKPNLNVTDAQAGRDFYENFLGLQEDFNLGWVVNYRSPHNRTAQVSLVQGDLTAAEDSVLTVALDDVDLAYAGARHLGYEIVHPLTTEEWGVRRFFVRDPHGNVFNLLGHDD